MKKFEIIFALLIPALLLVHFLGLLDQSMMFSGVLILLVSAYIALVFQEKVLDERDEYIRAKTDRYMFLLTLSLLTLLVLYKTFAHLDYFFEILLLASLSVGKLFISKFLRENN